MPFGPTEKALGAYHGVLGTVMLLTSPVAANGRTVMETVVFAAIGASVGFLTTWLWKQIFKKLNL